MGLEPIRPVKVTVTIDTWLKLNGLHSGDGFDVSTYEQDSILDKRLLYVKICLKLPTAPLIVREPRAEQWNFFFFFFFAFSCRYPCNQPQHPNNFSLLSSS